MNYYKFVKNYLGTDSCKEKSKYCNIGTTFCVCREEAEGCYWFYETDSFIVEIHDFFIKKDIVYSSALDVENMHKDYKFLLHSNFPYLSVGISFKKEMIEEYLYSLKKEKNISYSDIFTSFNPAIIKSFAPLAKEILNCKMKSPAAELFFEAKAKEWLSLTINAFFNNKDVRISKDDDKLLRRSLRARRFSADP